MMDLQLALAASAEKPVLRQLLGDCLVELGRYGEVDLAYPYFDAYWEAGEHRWPYLIRLGGRTVGFAFVNTWSPSGRGTDFAMAEFYVVPAARRSGVGRAAATDIIRRHAGQWELGIMAMNAPARRFWPAAIAAAGASALERVNIAGDTIYRFRIE